MLSGDTPLAVTIRNRQRRFRIRTRLLRSIALDVLQCDLQVPACQLDVGLLGPAAMARVNWDFLQHEGPTDVITFDYADPGPAGTAGAPGRALHGELAICPAVAADQAAEYQTSWTEELTRYLIHGLLHLQGYDDKNKEDRRVMKEAENRILDRVTGQFKLGSLETE